MVWVCSACGLENSIDTFRCKECGMEYGKHQNSRISIKLQSMRKVGQQEIHYGMPEVHYDMPEPIDISKINWDRPVEPAIGQVSPIKMTLFPLPIKIASLVAFACMIFSILLMLV